MAAFGHLHIYGIRYFRYQDVGLLFGGNLIFRPADNQYWNGYVFQTIGSIRAGGQCKQRSANTAFSVSADTALDEVDGIPIFQKTFLGKDVVYKADGKGPPSIFEYGLDAVKALQLRCIVISQRVRIA